MHPSRRAHRIHPIHGMLVIAALAAATSMPLSAHADDAPSPCTALKRIVAAAPTGFSQLTPEDGKGVAQPYGADAQCGATKGSYECSWTPSGGAGSSTAALQAVAADIASCLPDATHDVNSPARQHFYIGPRETRTQIAAMPAGANKVKLVVSGK
ncbi:hypothetical protein K788_0003917 [Paraburkholderia caribensis MBA4]|uniref:Uncharacterized protein n=1 Tax=Paraburkholderia caribensis MBA4 TaxID=1323664 RepID=A0A0P0RAK4_9BURK|nr:hypothetical protein [Paraburkholderia caribensis]ALL65383.1 hypothetical protein K788_0003917 [Paraburkholderia caribensis MBA4]